MTTFRCYQCDDTPCMHTPPPGPVRVTMGGVALWLPLRYSGGRIEDARGFVVAENVPAEVAPMIMQAPYLAIAVEKMEEAHAATPWTSQPAGVRDARAVARTCAERARQALGERRS